MNQDKFLYYSLGIGFFIVAVIFFYEDYSLLFAGNGNDTTLVEDPAEEDDTTADDDSLQTPTKGTYTVQEGETAYTIAAKFNLDIKELLALNPNKITETNTKNREGKLIYIVKPGEVLTVKKPGQ